MKVIIEFIKDWKEAGKKKGDVMEIDSMLARSIIDKKLAKKRMRKTKDKE